MTAWRWTLGFDFLTKILSLTFFYFEINSDTMDSRIRIEYSFFWLNDFFLDFVTHGTNGTLLVTNFQFA